MNPKLRSLLARVTLVAGVAAVAAIVTKGAPRDQTIAVRLGDVQVTRLEGVVTREGEREASLGFSEEFDAGSPRVVRRTFSAPDGTYIVVITLHSPEGASGAFPPNQPETTFERRVSLAGGEVIVSPD